MLFSPPIDYDYIKILENRVSTFMILHQSEDLLRRIIPKDVPNTFVPLNTIQAGYKYNFSINGTKMEIKWHSKDLNAANKFPGSNLGSGWTAQIKVGKKLLGQNNTFYKKARNSTHIPMKGGK